MPSLMRMMRHPNPYLRSKAVKMIGRGSQSTKWVMGRLSESDPRVRANAIESLWGVDTPEARTLLKFAASDANNRVAGNALLGLYHLGEASVLADVVNLAAHESAALSRLGRLGDGRNRRSAIHRCAAAPDLGTRSDGSQARLCRPGADQNGQRATPGRRRNGTWPGGCWPARASRDMRRLMLAVAADDMREPPKVAPLQFMLSEGGQHITSYKISEKPLPEAMSVIFVIPRSREAAGGAFFEGVANCLQWKRPSDLWSLLPYIETGDGEPPPPRDPEPPVFTGNARCAGSGLARYPEAAGLYRPVDRSLVRHQTGWRPIARQTPRHRPEQRRGRPHRRSRPDCEHAKRTHPGSGHRFRPQRAVAGILPANHTSFRMGADGRDPRDDRAGLSQPVGALRNRLPAGGARTHRFSKCAYRLPADGARP